MSLKKVENFCVNFSILSFSKSSAFPSLNTAEYQLEGGRERERQRKKEREREREQKKREREREREKKKRERE